MDEKRIWAPWRMGYVSGSEEAETQRTQPVAWREGALEDCFLCRAAATYPEEASAARQNLLLQRTERMIVVMNRFPYTNGHLLVSPVRHVGELTELDDEERLESVDLLDQYAQLLKRLIRAEGFNIGLNLGAVAGAGVPGHLHWHLVPRWPGDGNFMPVTAGVRVISQSLEALWDAISEAVH